MQLFSPFSKFFSAHLKTSFSHNLIKFLSDLKAKMVKAVVVLPPGAEELEFVASVDILRRAGVSFSSCFKILKFIDQIFYRLMLLWVD